MPHGLVQFRWTAFFFRILWQINISCVFNFNFVRDGCFCSTLFPWDGHSKWCKCFSNTMNHSINRRAVFLWITSELQSGICAVNKAFDLISDSFLLFGECAWSHSSWNFIFSLLNISPLNTADWLHHWPPRSQDQWDQTDVGCSDQDCQSSGWIDWPSGHHYRLTC